MANKPVAENTKRIGIIFPADILEKVEAAAKEKGLSVSAYIRMLVLEHFKE